MLIVLRLFARLPLRLLHALGAAGGWLVYLLSARYRTRLRENLALAGFGNLAGSDKTDDLVGEAIAQAGKAVLETPAIWFRPQASVGKLVRQCVGWDKVEAALARRKGILFLTPHLGCFEITAQYYALRNPLTVLYRPPRKQVLEPLMVAGRTRHNLKPAPANVKGVRILLKSLKRGEAVGILPDQVPRAGEGVWADFFGQPAYTMTLASRLVKSTGVPVILAFAERLPGGRGYYLHFEHGPEITGAESFEAAMNRALEQLIRRCPGQYLWAYNRYKTPKA
jgi:Kdo2-lipid IVA lauroyltransferase/acyltransferase